MIKKKKERQLDKDIAIKKKETIKQYGKEKISGKLETKYAY